MIPSPYLRFYFATKLKGKPSTHNLVLFDFPWSLLVHLPILTLFLLRDFLQSHHILALEMWGFTGVTLVFQREKNPGSKFLSNPYKKY